MCPEIKELDAVAYLKASLNILRLHQILRLHESFHAPPLAPSVGLTNGYYKMKKNS
jgi:hypothetical protein